LYENYETGDTILPVTSLEIFGQDVEKYLAWKDPKVQSFLFLVAEEKISKSYSLVSSISLGDFFGFRGSIRAEPTWPRARESPVASTGCGIPMCYLRARVLRRMLRVRDVRGRAHARAGNLELLLVVGLVRQQHAYLAPAIEEQSYRARPDYQH